MDSIRRPLHVIRYAALNALSDLGAIYTWRTWLFGWLGRMLAQVLFFVALGHVVGDITTVQFMVIGNAMMTSAIEAMQVIASTTWERAEGTLALLVAAPANVTWVFAGRSLQWPISGTGTSVVALLALGPIFGVRWTPAQVPVVIGLVILSALTTYCFGLVLAALVLNASGIRNLVSNVSYLVMMAICGVQVPVSYWPAPVRWIASGLPLTHFVEAVRRVHDSAPAGAVVTEVGLGLLLGAASLGVAWCAFTAFAWRGRRAGSLDFVT